MLFLLVSFMHKRTGRKNLWGGGAARHKAHCLLTFLPDQGQKFARVGLILEKFPKLGGCRPHPPPRTLMVLCFINGGPLENKWRAP